MILADFQEFVGRGFIGIFFVLAMFTLVVKNFVAKNPTVGDAAKKAATEKVISMIGKWLK